MKSLARWSVQTPVAANVLMALVVIGGLMSLMGMRREFFPEFELDFVTVSVPYPGASPSEVEEAICIRVEEEVEGIEGVKEITSNAFEGLGVVAIELDTSADPQEAYDDVRNAVDRIDTFPDDAEEAVIEKLSIQRSAIYVLVYGDADERVLRRLAENLRDKITATDEVSIANIAGARDYEISVEISEKDLRRYGLSFDAVAGAVSRGSLDLPAGQIKTPGGDILVRAKGQRYTGREFRDIPLLSRPDGTVVRLGDVATIYDGFEDADRYTRFAGKRAIAIDVRQTSTQDMIDVVDTTKQVVEKFRATLPGGVEVATVFDASILVRDRIDLLLRNGAQGFVLVFLSLWIFLRWRLAFWVAVGIPISFMGGFIILKSQGATINMLSLFAFIMTLGIVVDDAIIVGENIYAHYRKKESAFRAAMNGAAEVGWPVVISVLTTIVAFCPLLFVTGIMGKFIAVMPVAVIATLVVSLVEAFLILPAHIKHSLEGSQKRGEDMQPGVRTHVIDAVIDRFYEPRMLRPALRWRYFTIAAALAAVIVAVGLVAGGRIPFIVFPKFDSNYVLATLEFPEGTPVETTEQAVRQIERGLEQTARKNADRIRPKRDDNLVVGMMSFVGAIMPQGSQSGSAGANVAQVLVELLPTEDRTISSDDILKQWRSATGEIPGVERLTFSGGQAGPGGAPIEIRLLGQNLEDLEAAAEELKDKLGTYAGVFDISDSFQPGKWEIKVRAKPTARAMGITLGDIALQLRQAYYGDEAVRIQRGRDDLKVMVRYTEPERSTRASFQNMRIRNAAGDEVPLAEVAEVDFGRGYAKINRARRMRAITVTADLDETKANAQEIVQELVFGPAGRRGGGGGPMAMIRAKLKGEKKEPPKGFLPLLIQRHPGVQYDLEGQARNTRESVGSLMVGFAYALVGIFCLLAAQFRSYMQPIIVMCAIPVSLVGALGGHFILGRELTLISLFGIVALAGIVVNDSLVLIDFINRRVREGMTPAEAAVDGGKARFRAIMLTSITTIAGLVPLLIENSMQAQFLIPMAISIAFGLMAATVLTLVITPCLYMAVADVKALFGMPASEPIEEDDEERQCQAPANQPEGSQP